MIKGFECNLYFSGITINSDDLASLSEDDLISIRTIMISSEEPHDPKPTQEKEPYVGILSRTFIPAACL